jgi:hypothetical protein
VSGLRAVRNVLRPALVVMRAAQARPVQARPEVQVQPAAQAKVKVCKREERGQGLFLLHHLSAALPCREGAGRGSGGGSGGDPLEGSGDGIFMSVVEVVAKPCQRW